MILNEIHIQGFGSINTPVTYKFQRGTDIFLGANGAGKSTLFNAVCWVLYGKHPKKIIKSDIGADSELFKIVEPLSVTLKFSIKEDNFEVTRTASSLEFKVNGEIRNGLHIADTDKEIIKYAPSFEVFTTALFIPQSAFKFLEQGNTYKKSFLTSVLIPENLELAKERADAEYNALQRQINKVEGEKSKLDGVLEQIKLFEDTYTKDIKEAKKLTKELAAKIEYKDLDIAAIKEFVNDTRKECYRLERVINSTFNEQTILDKCNVCGGDLDSNLVTKLKQEQREAKEKHEVEKANATERLIECERKLYTYELVLQQHNELKEAENKLKYLQSKKQNTNKKEVKQKLYALNKQLAELNKNLNAIEFWSKKGFAANGFPTFLLKRGLSKLNKKLLKYSRTLGSKIIISLDDTKSTQPLIVELYANNAQTNYEKLSGGEKVRVNMITVLALNDLVREQCGTDFMILDEVFEALDEQGCAAVTDLINENENTYKGLITHRGDISFSNCTVVYVTKEKNQTFFNKN